MTSLGRLVGAGLLALGALLAGPARTGSAAPVVERVETELRRGRTLIVSVEASFDGPGEVALEGTVGGRPVAFRKRVRKARSKRWRFRVPARKAGRRPLDDIRFELRAVLAHADGSRIERDVEAAIPVPLVILPGLGNEIPELHPTGPALAPFAALLDVARGALYTTDGDHPDLVVHGYPSLDASLRDLGRDLHKTVRRLLRRSPYRRVDVVGYSMGGLVARSWGAAKGRGRVRNMVFLGTPHEGTPLAYLASLLTSGQLDGLLGNVQGADTALGFLDLLADGNTDETLRLFYPTYPWVRGLFGGATNPIADEAVLTALNALPPDPLARYHALAYSEAPAGESTPLGTLDTVDALVLAAALAGGGLEGLDPLTLLDGEGDLVVPLRSAFLADVPAWADVVRTWDMGTGVHVGYPADPRVIARVAALLDARE